MTKFFKIALVSAALLIFSGCTTNKEISQFNTSSNSSDYEEAAKFAEKKADGFVGGILGKLNLDTSKKKDLYW